MAITTEMTVVRKGWSGKFGEEGSASKIFQGASCKPFAGLAHSSNLWFFGEVQGVRVVGGRRSEKSSSPFRVRPIVATVAYYLVRGPGQDSDRER